MTIQFQGSGGFNEKYFAQRFEKGQKLSDGNTVTAILSDGQLSQKELQSLRQDYLSQAKKEGLSEAEALEQFNLFLADSLDGQLNHLSQTPLTQAITDLGFLFDESAAIQFEAHPREGSEPTIEFQTGRLGTDGFQAISFPELVAQSGNTETRQAELNASWSDSMKLLSASVFKASDNTSRRDPNDPNRRIRTYTSPETLIGRYKQQITKQRAELAEIENNLYRLQGQPDADKAPLKDEIERTQDLADLLRINLRVNQAFSMNGNKWRQFNTRVDTKALAELNQCLRELELFKIRLGQSPQDKELQAHWQQIRNTVEAVTLALGNPQYTAMNQKQPMDLHVTSTAHRYDMHKAEVRDGNRRDVDASPTGFMKAKILEGQYDEAYALKISKMLDELDRTPLDKFKAKAASVRSEIEKMVRPSIVGDAEYRQAILDMVDARILSRGVQLEIPEYQQQYASLRQQEARVNQAVTGKAPQLSAEQLARLQRPAISSTYVRQPLASWQTAQPSTGLPQASEDPIDQMQAFDARLAATRKDAKEDLNTLAESDKKARSSDDYVTRSRTGGSAVGRLMNGENQQTLGENQQARTTVQQVESGATTMAKDAAALEAKHWQDKLTAADGLFFKKVFEACKDADEDKPAEKNLHALGECYQALSLYSQEKWKDNIDLEKLQAKIAELSQKPEVQAMFEKVRQEVVKETYSDKQLEQIATHLRSPEFKEMLFDLPKEQQQEELQKNLRVLAFAKPELAAEISQELCNAYILERPESVLNEISQAEKESAFEQALDALGDTGKVVTGGGTLLRNANELLTLSAAGKADIAKALARIPAKELRTCLDNRELMKLINRELLAMGKDINALTKDLNVLRKMANSGRITGFALAATAAVGHLGAELLSGELISSIKNYGIKAAESIGGIFSKSTKGLPEVGKVADEATDMTKGIKGLKNFKWPSWMSKAGGQIGKIMKFAGPIGEAFALFSDFKGMQRDIKDGDTLGASMKGVQVVAGATGLGTAGLLAFGLATGPAAPFVIAGALIVGIGAWIVDACFGKSEEQSMLERLGVYKEN